MIRLTLLALAMLAGASAAAAQTAAPPAVEFVPRTLFYMGAERLSGDDIRFSWDANFGGEFDFVDYGYGRVTFFGQYQVVMGDELKAFDPNQGNYILEGSASARLAGAEVAAVFYHQSRHLSDRDKTQPVDWNMLGVRVKRNWIAGD